MPPFTTYGSHEIKNNLKCLDCFSVYKTMRADVWGTFNILTDESGNSVPANMIETFICRLLLNSTEHQHYTSHIYNASTHLQYLVKFHRILFTTMNKFQLFTQPFSKTVSLNSWNEYTKLRSTVRFIIVKKFTSNLQ